MQTCAGDRPHDRPHLSPAYAFREPSSSARRNDWTSMLWVPADASSFEPCWCMVRSPGGATPVRTCTLLTRLRAAMFWHDFREQFIPHLILLLNCSALAYLCAPLTGMHLSLHTVLV